MSSKVRPELPTASVGSSQAPTAAVDNSAPFSNCPQSTYKSGKAVQTNGATSVSDRSSPNNTGMKPRGSSPSSAGAPDPDATFATPVWSPWSSR